MLISLAATAILLGWAVQDQPKPQATLVLQNGAFVYRLEGSPRVTEPLTVEQKPDAKQVVFRRNNDYAVWDGRGLSVRHGNRTKSWKLGDVALTPKLFTKDQILRTKALIAQGVRQRDASALSGSKRVGSNAYFLVRWVDSKGATWLEALMKVDMASDSPTPKLVGKYDGFSLATKPVDDKMFLLGGALCAVTRSASEWHLARFDPVTEKFSSYTQGLKLAGYKPIGREMGIFIEKSPTGTRLVGRVDLVTGSRRNLLETRQPVWIFDGKRPSIAILSKTVLHNLESGVQTPMPAGATVRRTLAGILVWWPASTPKKAVMLDPERWSTLAKWEQGASPPSPAQPARIRRSRSVERDHAKLTGRGRV